MDSPVTLKETLNKLDLELPNEALLNRANGEKRKTKRGDFWHWKYYRFPRRLVYDVRYWNRNYVSRYLLPVIGVHSSGIPKRGTCFLGHRLLSRLSGVGRNDIHKAITGLTKGVYPLVNMVNQNIGSKSVQYGLHRNAKANWKSDRYFPFYGWYLYNGLWAKLSSTAKDLYIICGAVSYQDPRYEDPSPLDSEHIRLANLSDVEEAVDVMEDVFNKGEKKPEYIDLDEYLEELELLKMLKVNGSQIEIPLIDPDQIEW